MWKQKNSSEGWGGREGERTKWRRRRTEGEGRRGREEEERRGRRGRASEHACTNLRAQGLLDLCLATVSLAKACLVAKPRVHVRGCYL